MLPGVVAIKPTLEEQVEALAEAGEQAVLERTATTLVYDPLCLANKRRMLEGTEYYQTVTHLMRGYFQWSLE